MEIQQKINLEKITPLNPFSEMSKGGRMAVEGILEIIEKNCNKKVKKEPYIYIAKIPFNQMEVLNYLKMYFVNFSDVDSLFLFSGMEILVDIKTILSFVGFMLVIIIANDKILILLKNKLIGL